MIPATQKAWGLAGPGSKSHYHELLGTYCSSTFTLHTSPLFSMLCVEQEIGLYRHHVWAFLYLASCWVPPLRNPGRRSERVRSGYLFTQLLPYWVTVKWLSSHYLIDDPLDITFSHQLTSLTSPSPSSYRTKNGNNPTVICPWVLYYSLWFSYTLSIFLFIVSLLNSLKLPNTSMPSVWVFFFFHFC